MARDNGGNAFPSDELIAAGSLSSTNQHEGSEQGVDRLAQEELRDIFGERIPLEAVKLLWHETPETLPIPELRKRLRKIASEQAPTNEHPSACGGDTGRPPPTNRAPSPRDQMDALKAAADAAAQASDGRCSTEAMAAKIMSAWMLDERWLGHLGCVPYFWAEIAANVIDSIRRGQ